MYQEIRNSMEIKRLRAFLSTIKASNKEFKRNFAVKTLQHNCFQGTIGI
jgi:hypothetical protein